MYKCVNSKLTIHIIECQSFVKGGIYPETFECWIFGSQVNYSKHLNYAIYSFDGFWRFLLRAVIVRGGNASLERWIGNTRASDHTRHARIFLSTKRVFAFPRESIHHSDLLNNPAAILTTLVRDL